MHAKSTKQPLSIGPNLLILERSLLLHVHFTTFLIWTSHKNGPTRRQNGYFETRRHNIRSGYRLISDTWLDVWVIVVKVAILEPVVNIFLRALRFTIDMVKFGKAQYAIDMAINFLTQHDLSRRPLVMEPEP